MSTWNEDPLRALHERPAVREPGTTEQVTQALIIAIAGIETQLKRIADALETQVAAQEASAAFARLLTRGVDPDEVQANGFEDYRLADDGVWRVLSGGQWRDATMAEEQEIADMNQKRRRR
jgi:hypothetical protein